MVPIETGKERNAGRTVSLIKAKTRTVFLIKMKTFSINRLFRLQFCFKLRNIFKTLESLKPDKRCFCFARVLAVPPYFWATLRGVGLAPGTPVNMEDV